MNEKERCRVWATQLIGPDEIDKFDFNSEWSDGLSLVENKTIIREKIRCIVGEGIKEKAARIKADIERVKYEEEQKAAQKIKEAEAEANVWNRKVTQPSNVQIEAYYEPIYRAVKKVCQGYSNLLFVEGRGGIGKSTAIKRQLIESKADYIEICGEVTEAYLYRLIYENNGKIIYMKDLVKVLQGLKSINLLKAATESDGNTCLTKSSYSRVQEDLPDKFLCKCKFIFDFNSVQSQFKSDWEALISRGSFINYSLSNDDVKSIMLQIADEPWKKEVTEYIIDNFEKQHIVRLNLRTQWKAFQTYNYAIKNNYDWHKEVEADMKNLSKTRAMIYSLIGEKMVRTAELKKLLLKAGIFNTIRTCDNKVAEWVFVEEIQKCSEEEKNYMVKL